MPSRIQLRLVAAAAAGGLLLVGCSPGEKAEAPAPTEPPTVHTVMTSVIAPDSQTLWDVPNKGLDDNGDVDAALLTNEDWDQVLTAAQRVHDAATELAQRKSFKVADPGVVLQQEENPGASKAADVQRFVDADPAGFAKQWADLAGTAAKFSAAAKAKDGKMLGAASTELDQVCEACHVKFWYPQDAAAASKAN